MPRGTIPMSVYSRFSPAMPQMKGSVARVDVPRWQEDGLLVVHPQRAGFGGLTQQVQHALDVGQVEVEVGIHAPLLAA
ncbi:hypothetical protein [Hymenobacter terrenus]|uniref:hypothetical protein n=1 Tax=Hymenobacter terrenus TaxID=1629124 RepID=UPI0012E0C2B2|nr:hypothetical protein [Hymenobacter terrenus]